MTTITINRDVFAQHIQGLIEVMRMPNTEHVADAHNKAVRFLRAALAAQPEQCWCDEQGIGKPGVSCGDCPTRDYKQPSGPAWQDAPEREAFEAFCKDSGRHPDDMKMAIWQAACAWQRERDEAICAEFSQDAYARYRASRREYDDGQCDAANALADKIRSNR